MNLTIVTAAWRAENLPKIIESIENQTVKGFEHLIINDNNPEVRNVFKDLCDGKHRHWIDIGVRTHFFGAIARNIGVMSAFSYVHHSKRNIENEWIIFLDDDNLWKPNHLQTIVETLEQNPDATMIATDA
jgi:glycosyltransferase involved in cell wall biosynthesis